MLTRKDIEMTVKYLDEYTRYCKQTECGTGCPVFEIHQGQDNGNPMSCFKIYCQLRESGKLQAPSSN